MGKKLDALLGRTFKATKFKAIANLAISRLAVLKNQRQARLRHARSDVLELLQLGHLERASLRVRYYTSYLLSHTDNFFNLITLHYRANLKLGCLFFCRLSMWSRIRTCWMCMTGLKDTATSWSKGSTSLNKKGWFKGNFLGEGIGFNF